MNKKNYIIFDPQVNSPLHLLDKKEAKEHFQLFISNIDERIKILQDLVSFSNIELDLSLISIEKLDNWFVQCVKENVVNGKPDSFIFSICNDLAMYFGRVVISKCENVFWKLNTIRPSDISYNRPVLSGFNVKNKNYYVDFDLVLGQYAHRIAREKIEENLLVKMVDSAINKCHTG
ncbi:hypothetical protein [Aequorivita antarctica]|uniref:Uncharacterized protein n=1 Tax=Aequorivita antarctica TaxID=153266 RepID=A0A5C6YVI9_9FLAO|nr:hypothetical protein [Aequorivita antarctica]TXD71584.1 hypothetical protein ESU54_16305 [Aequorivita antarctica]SRX75271.1 hypothetical protein AEQU3_02265 [Aequorivita antarctica]